ncbi:hypothetical protein CY35_03G017000 [Sphagnum magellanicum]|nr:hypothetical protein CY35_03G017000 [Sphagnum magellanicum]
MGNPLGNVTVFAPNNQAFIRANGFFTQLYVSGTNLNAIAAHGNNKAASILLYHIVSSPYVASELLDAADAHMLLQTELSGYNLTVSTSTGSVRNTSCLNPEVKIKIHEYLPVSCCCYCS